MHYLLGVDGGPALCALGGRDEERWPSGERLLWARSTASPLSSKGSLTPSINATVDTLLPNPATHTHTHTIRGHKCIELFHQKNLTVHQRLLLILQHTIKLQKK